MPKPPASSKQQDAAEADVEGYKRDLGPFVVAADTTRMPMIFTDAKQTNNSIIFANDSFVDLIGYQRDEILGQGFNFVLASDTDEEALAAIAATFEDGFCGSMEICCRRKDGSTFWADIFISAVQDESGDTIQHFASLVDLTRHKEEEVWSGMLIDELNDRVRNMLAAVQTIISQAFRKNADPAATRDFIALRVAALSRSHTLLSQGNWARAGLREIIEYALQPFTGSDVTSRRYKVTGDDVRFSPKRALALGIALHELALNAVIHGALSNDAGSVSVSWSIVSKPAGDRLILVWREKDGPSVTASPKPGYGSRVIEKGLAHELEAEVHMDYLEDGVICTIEMAPPRDGGDA